VRRLIAGTLPSNAVALTLDDGYVDNLISGKPLLEAADTSATVFLATGYIGCSEPFWWDELASLILTEASSQHIELEIHGELMQFDLRTASDADGGSPNLDASANKRHAAMWTIWEALRRLDDQERRSEMVNLRSIFAMKDERANLGRAMTENEVHTISSDGLVAVGAHTVTHPVLSRLEARACHHEITASKLACEALIGKSVAAFAYPYGDFNAVAREAVRAADFSLACATRRVPASVTSDIFSLPRIHVPNIGGDSFERALRTASATN
jgi:peptidoglycan/xylan/chitin deacetylase (PgdA/CDA1 family)